MLACKIKLKMKYNFEVLYKIKVPVRSSRVFIIQTKGIERETLYKVKVPFRSSRVFIQTKGIERETHSVKKKKLKG
jgi:hypothetical protein